MSDEGPGIEHERLERIFEAFHRGEGLPEGVGLGLAVAAHAAILLQARLAVESKVGEGSTFTLFVPVPS